jgi:hypothetical protein
MPETDPQRELIPWKIAGIVATAVVVLSIPLYSLLERRELSVPQLPDRPAPATFVGSRECRDCHREAYDKWQGSHHRQAMAVASDKSVRGDFDNATFEHFGVTSRFYRKKGRYFVHTRGPGGEMGDFEITHTFGWTPLQQYLVPFPAAAAVPAHRLGREKKALVSSLPGPPAGSPTTGSTGPTRVRTGTACVPNATPRT